MTSPEYLAAIRNKAYWSVLNLLTERSEIWASWRVSDPREHPEFRLLDLREKDLHGLDFNNMVLSYSDLSGANLSGANLYWTELAGCKLTGADLGWANLSWARLEGADLTGANLAGANFSFSHLAETNFSQTKLYETVFVDVDLSTAKGLETVEHLARSPISVETLYRSDGKIPEVFLRGAGLPEELIVYLPSLLAKPLEYYSCFISYSHADKSFARRLHDGLQGIGIRCWLDEHQMLPGDDIHEQIDRGIKLWDKILLCCSEHSLTSWWVDAEITKAFKKEQELMKQRGKKILALIPLNLDGYMFTDKWQSGKADEIKSRVAANFKGWKRNNAKFEKEFERVAKALRINDGGRETPPMPKL